jgi:hypothetical protein
MATITVGCKLPHGLIIEVDGHAVTLNGKNSSNVIGGYGLTEGVDKDFFGKWMSANRDSAAVKNGLIFAQDRADSARSEAKERKGVKNGTEGIDPNKPAPGVEPTEETKRELAKAGV